MTRPAPTTRRCPSLPRLTLWLLLVGTMGVGAPLAAQPDPYEVQRLDEGVYAVIRTVPTTGASDANVLVIINAEDVVVVDSGIYPSSAKEVIGEIRRLTPLPVRYLINTHFHSDHHYGNEEYVKAWPDVEIVQHPETRRLVLEDDIPSLERNVTTEYPQTIARLRASLESGTTSTGDSLTAAQRTRLEGAVGMYEFFLADVHGMRQRPATLTVADSLVWHRGERTIVVKWLGSGNTPGDLVVHLPVEGIVATGDLVVAPLPFAFGSFVREWPSTLRALRATGATRVVPGHGYVMTDWSYVEQLEELLETTWTRVQEAYAPGMDAAAVRQAVDLGPIRQRFTQGDPAMEAGFDRLFLTPAVEAAVATLASGG